MKSLTFTVSKGGVGKSLITANVGASLATKGNKVVLIEGDPNQPLQKMLGLNFSPQDPKLEDVIERDEEINKVVYPTAIKNLYLVPSGISLQSYFDIDPIRFAYKLSSLETDFILIDVPFPLGRAAFLSLGICDYFIPILTEDEFILCVESAIDTIRLGKYLLKSTPIGFILNRIKNTKKFSREFIKDLEDLLEIPCITKIKEDPRVSRSYGGIEAKKAFLAYYKFQRSEFAKKIDKISSWLLSQDLQPKKKNPEKLLQKLIKPLEF